MAVFLRRYQGFGTELVPIVDIGTETLFDMGAVINALSLPGGSNDDRTGPMFEMRREGIDL